MLQTALHIFKVEKSVLPLFLLFLCFPAFSQDTTLIDLHSKLDSSVGTERISLLYDLGRAYVQIDSTKAADYIQEALEISESSNDGEGLIRGNIEMAELYSKYKHPHLAIESILELSNLDGPLSFQDSIALTDILSVSFIQLRMFEIAIYYRKIFNRLIGRLNPDEDWYYSNENIAYLYGEVQKYDSASFYYDKAIKIARGLGNASMLMHCHNNMGYNFDLRDMHDEALSSYREAIDFFRSKNDPTTSDSLLYAIVLGNMANIHFQLENYDTASSKLAVCTALLRQLNDQGNPDSLHYGDYMTLYAAVDIELKRYASAAQNLEKTYPNIKYEPSRLLKYYQVLVSLYEATGQTKKALEASEKQYEQSREINKLTKRANSQAHDLVALHGKRIQKEIGLMSRLMNSEKKVNSLKILFVGGLSFLTFVIILILFYRYRSEQRKKQKLFAMESDMAKLKLMKKSLESARLKEVLDYKNKDLVDFAIDITRKHEFIKELLERLNQLRTSDNMESDLRETTVYIKSQLQIDNNLKLFQENINKVNHEFMVKLREHYPDLTPNEQQICALLRLQLSTKEIATVKNISPDSVKVLRHRLRKKMNLGSDVSMSEFLDELI